MPEFMPDISAVCPPWIVVSGFLYMRLSSYLKLTRTITNHFVSNFHEELNDESGNPIWKNRVESWKDKKSKKKKAEAKVEQEAQVPPEQHIEEMP